MLDIAWSLGRLNSERMGEIQRRLESSLAQTNRTILSLTKALNGFIFCSLFMYLYLLPPIVMPSILCTVLLLIDSKAPRFQGLCQVTLGCHKPLLYRSLGP